MTVLKGKAWKVGNDVDTDVIIAARYLNTSDPEILAAHCLEDLFPLLSQEIKRGDILVAGKNFGCGSSREHAPLVLKQVGFSCIIAESYARIFYRNAVNIGLPIITAKEASREIEGGSLLEVNPAKGTIKDLSKGNEYAAEQLPPFMLEIIEKGGMIPYIKEKVKKNV